MDIGVPELLIVLVIVVLIFGVGRVGKLGSELGKGIRSFREGLNSSEDSETKPETKPADQQDKS
jgi:sec-independent protein translocase protein TatA